MEIEKKVSTLNNWIVSQTVELSSLRWYITKLLVQVPLDFHDFLLLPFLIILSEATERKNKQSMNKLPSTIVLHMYLY